MTGGMASGKSTALDLLEQLGAATISSDAVVHDLLGSDEVRDAVAARLGDEVIGADGALDRGAMAAKVFASDADREWLEQLLWPRVRERVAQWYAGLEGVPAAVVEVPLLFESGGEAVYHHTIAVVADEEVRSERAGARGHEGVDERTGRQLTQDEKSQRADFTVRNDGTREELRAQLSRVLATIGED
ncbi:MAG TPA: dephospho-CoA kinase [Thermoleophilaceae bacterium]|nr:dephospho-CoA kinase [Thermoleophilaceae bacterium]